MTAVPLGQGAYKRLYAGTPEIRLLNRWIESDPANLREHSSVLSRPGTTPQLQLDPGGYTGLTPMRGNYTLGGLFNDSLFVVCGENLYKIAADMTVVQIEGVIAGSGHPEVAWQKGAGYERLWITDGLTLQFYSGTTAAHANLTLTPPVTNGVDVFEVGGTYYTWGATFANTDAGTSSHPFIVNPTNSTGQLDPMNQLILAIIAGGTAGVDYSATIAGANTQVTASATAGGITNIDVTNGGTSYTTVPTVTITDPTGTGATAHAVLSGTEVGAVVVDTQGYGYSVTPEIQFTGGTGSGAFAVAGVSQPTVVDTITISALKPGVDGNSISLTVTGGTALSASSTTLLNGGIDALEGCAIPNGQTPLSLAQVSSFMLVSIANTQQFYWVNPGEVTIDPLNFASKESSPDPIIAMRTLGDQVAIVGAKSYENWYATGDSTNPFAPIEGRVYARGVVDGTAVVVDDGILLVGDDGRVYSIGFQSGDATDIGWGVTRISNNGIEERIRRQIRREGGLTP